MSADFIVVDSARPNERMTVQQGVFTTTNAIILTYEQFLENLTGPADPNDLVKLVISADCKAEILERLREMNVHGASLFPGLDGVGKMMSGFAAVLAHRLR